MFEAAMYWPSSPAHRPFGGTFQSPRRTVSARRPRAGGSGPAGMFEAAMYWPSLRDTVPTEARSPRGQRGRRMVSGGKRRCGRTATSRGGHLVIAGDGTNSLLTVGPTSGVGGNCSGVSLEMRGATTAGPLCAAERKSGTGRGLAEVGARATTLDSVDRRGAGATEAHDLCCLII